ncbi:MAG TPA: DNA primase [Polyangiaceae bacterium]|jgi:DNA primase
MIPKDTITLIRDRTDIVAVISESVPSLKKRGRRFLGLCPFHKEKTPSFNVNQDTGVYHCFGCKESGDVFTFLQKADGYTFHEAVRALAERAGIAIEEERGAPPSEADRHKKEREALYAAMTMAAAFYEEQLRTHPHKQLALDELARRDLAVDHEAMQAFRIGYAPPGWDGLALHLKKHGVSPAVGESVGLLVPRSSAAGYYDRFRHRLMFAVMDAQGRVVAFSGRALKDIPGEDGEENRDPPPKYINSPESPIYVKGANLFGLWQARHAIRQQEHAVLVEGNFDVVSLHARGVQNVVAPLGTAFTADQAKLLRRYATDLTLLFDGDAAGRKAALAAEQPCDEVGLDVKVSILPEKTDPDDLVRKKGVDALRHVLDQSRGLFEYLIDILLDESFNAADLREKATRVERVGALIARQKDAAVRGIMAEGYADAAAGRLDLVRSPGAFGALKRQILSQARAARIDFGPRPSEARLKPRAAGSEDRKAIAEAILDFPELLDDSEVQTVLPHLEATSARIVAAMAGSMRVNARGEKVLDTTEFLAQMQGDAKAFASARLAAPMHETIDEARETVTKAAKRLRGTSVARETNEIVREQHRVVGDWDTEVELAKHANELVRQRLMGK